MNINVRANQYSLPTVVCHSSTPISNTHRQATSTVVTCMTYVIHVIRVLESHKSQHHKSQRHNMRSEQMYESVCKER